MSRTTRTLGDICDEVGGIIRTGPFGSQLHESDYRDEGTPMVMPKNIIDGKVSTEDIALLSDEDMLRLAQHKLKTGDIVYGRRGDIGRRALVAERENGWLCGTGCLRISLGDTVLDPTFLYYYLGETRVVAWIAQQAVGATMPNLNTDIVRSIPITYPPLPTQRKIAAILSAYDDLIANNTRRIALLEALAQTLYREWFVHFRFPGHAAVPPVDSPLGPIPAGWGVRQIGEIAKVRGGKRLPQGKLVQDERSEHPYIRVVDFGTTRLDRSDIRYVDDETHEAIKRYIITSEDIYISIAGTIGRVGIVPKDLSGANLTENAAKICEIDPSVDKYFLMYYLQSPKGQAQIAAKTGGTSQPKLALFKLQEIEIPFPPIALQQKSAAIFAAFQNLIAQDEMRILNLRRTRDLLLPRLISGAVDVAGLEIQTE
jgi:type I restriction enzyme S subunit